MSQLSKPNSDISNSTWTPTPVYTRVNEKTPDDSNFVTSNGTIPEDVFEVGLERVMFPKYDPLVPWALKVRWATTGSGSGPVGAKVELRQEVDGTVNLIAMGGEEPGGSFGTYTITLTQTEIGLIQYDTDGGISGLRVRVSAQLAVAPTAARPCRFGN